jgi:hypothetical protein
MLSSTPAPHMSRFKKKLPIVLTIMTEGKTAKRKREIAKEYDKTKMLQGMGH